MKVLCLILALLVVVQAIPRRNNVTPKVRKMPLAPGAPTNPPAKITNGYLATRGQFPYQVGIFLDDTHFCGGSIIDASWILTAGHCCEGVSTFQVQAGAQNLYDVDGQTIIISNKGILHEGYDSNSLNNDVCLVELPYTLTFNSFIAPIKLIGRTTDQFVGRTVRVSGWGRISDSDPYITDELHYIDMTVITNAECKAYYDFMVVSSTICTSVVNGQGTCNGDSGGALIIGTGGTDAIQIGVVSYIANAGCEVGAPAGFARVSEFMDWIQTHSGITF